MHPRPPVRGNRESDSVARPSFSRSSGTISLDMAEHTTSIEVSDVPEILRLAEEVQRVGKPRVLRRNGEDLAMVVPLPHVTRSHLRKPTEADLETFRSAAGSWADIDGEALVEVIYRAREEGTRPDNRP